MAEVCRALLGPEVWVFWEQYVVKGAENGMSFSWHQDSGYVSADTPHRPYLTCWVALDDMVVENGTVYVLPTPRVGIRTRVQHIHDPETNDQVGYFGADPGDPVICPAGSIACFSSVVFHRSGWNRTPRLRRTYLIQYSGEPIARKDGVAWGRTERVLKAGELQPTPAKATGFAAYPG
jgi:ectoine hydroxylase-related dioxygenase (phytanoyl-CoA dioxygenase family)